LILVNSMLQGWVLQSRAEYFFIRSGVGWLAVTQLFSSF
jgi:hypothetical protein